MLSAVKKTAQEEGRTLLLSEPTKGFNQAGWVEPGVRAGVARKADLLQLDGEHLREELADGGAWCTAEPHWAAMVRAKMGWHRSKADPAVPMPEPEVRAGSVLAFRLDEDEGGAPVDAAS